MRPKALTVTEVIRNFSDYISRVAYQRESFILCKGKRPMAELRPVPAGKQLGELPAILAGLPHLSRPEAIAFAKDLETERDALGGEELQNPWDS
ncbi:hypothetical protein ACFL3F_04155 [Planctomycetota bacterium]